MEKTFFTLVNNYGVIPSLILLAALIWFFLREIKKDIMSLQKAYLNLEEKLNKRIGELGTEMGKHVEQLDRRVSIVERDYLTREDHYRDIGGWREEIHEIRRTLDSYLISRKEEK